jgi:hypothetical protein
MFLLRLFLLGWLSVGVVTVALLFWLCRRTATKESGNVSSYLLRRPVTDDRSGEIRPA